MTFSFETYPIDMGIVRKRGKKWYIDYRDASGKRQRKVAGTTKKQAERILAEKESRKYYEKENIPVLDRISVEELWERFISMKKKRVRPRTMDSWNPRLNFWKEKHLQKSENFSLLPLLIIDRIVDELAKKYSAKTVNDYINVLQQIYRYAKDLNLLQQSPAEKIKRLKESPKKTPRFLSKEEVDRILEHSNDFYKSLFQFFLYTGIRRNEIRFLEWSDIDFENDVKRGLQGFYIQRIIRVRFAGIVNLLLNYLLGAVSLTNATQYIDPDTIDKIRQIRIIKNTRFRC